MTLSISLPFLGDSLPLPLHAPDGFFSLPVAVAGYVAAAVFIGIAIRQTNKNLNERIVPMMGVMAAFIFAAQMLNFPVAGGTSGHLNRRRACRHYTGTMGSYTCHDGGCWLAGPVVSGWRPCSARHQPAEHVNY